MTVRDVRRYVQISNARPINLSVDLRNIVLAYGNTEINGKATNFCFIHPNKVIKNKFNKTVGKTQEVIQQWSNINNQT